MNFVKNNLYLRRHCDLTIFSVCFCLHVLLFMLGFTEFTDQVVPVHLTEKR